MTQDSALCVFRADFLFCFCKLCAFATLHKQAWDIDLLWSYQNTQCYSFTTAQVNSSTYKRVFSKILFC